MEENINSIEDSVYHYPLPLLDIKDDKTKSIIDKYLPYSTGFEIECGIVGDIDNISLEFGQIPNIISYDINKSEQRLRIPNGLKGLVCLYEISLLLQKYAHLTNSGIHYHVDCSDWIENVYFNVDFIKSINDWVIKELETWEYKGSYNTKKVGDKGCWLAFRSNTLEFRIGEMTFDYEILVKRIIHANRITRRIKGEWFRFEKMNKVIILEKELEKLEEELSEEDETNSIPSNEELKEIIKKRQIII